MGIRDVTCCGDLWWFETANVVECRHTLDRSQDCYPAKLVQMKLWTINDPPLLLHLLTQFQTLLSGSVRLSRQDSLCHVIDEERTSIWRHEGFRREKYTKAEQINDPGVCYTYARQCSPSNFPAAQNCFHPTHIILSSPPPTTLNFTLSCLNSKRIHVVFIPSPHSLLFSARHCSRRADPLPLHLDLNIRHDT